ncbi:MAG: sensor domain-containing diguanylate cyclase [Chloroflexi bacterium]|nr:sensor domain-containing diguanylate cyclase [Chloroflexota bacterium]
MNIEREDRDGTFRRAWEVINKDTSMPPDEKKGILKLIQVLISAAESSPYHREATGQVKTFTQEVISRHSLMALVKQQADELDALKRLSLNLTSSLDLQTVLDAVVNEAMSLVKNSRSANIFLYSHGRLDFGASLNSEGIKNKIISMPRAEGLTYSVANSGEQIIIEDMASHPIYKTAPIDWTGSVIGIPLKFNHSIVGVMNLSRSITGEFSKAEMRLISLLADQAAVAIYNASLHKQVTDLANTDSVTGLPNRRALDERLQDEMQYAKRMRSMFSVVMMDLDGFKSVNDLYGHAIGDELLNSLFNYLSENMRATDFLARYGGDELTLVIRNADLEAAEAVTLKILELMKNYEYQFPGTTEIQLGISAGIAVYPTHAHTAGDLLRAADTAMYHAKKHNRGSFIIANGATGPLNPLMLASD